MTDIHHIKRLSDFTFGLYASSARKICILTFSFIEDRFELSNISGEYIYILLNQI